MLNKVFYSKTRATQYFYDCAEDYICFMIYDYEADKYSVIDENTLRFLQEDYNLYMDVLLES